MVDQQEYDEMRKLLREAIEKRGEREVAEALDVPIPTIKRWDKGGNLPHITLVATITAALRAMNEAG